MWGHDVSHMSLEQQTQLFKDTWLDYVCELTGYDDEEAIEAFVSQLQHLREKAGFSVTVYRSMIISEEMDALLEAGNTLDAGRYWSSERDVAFNWGHGNAYQDDFPALTEGTRVILTATVSPSDVDWVETVACQLGSSYEQEIRLKSGCMITVENVDRSPNNSMTIITPSF